MGGQLITVHSSGSRTPDSIGDLADFFFLSGVRLLSSKSILYLILPSEFQLFYRCYCSLYSTFLFETLWLDIFFVCVCDVLGVALFWLSSFFFAEIGFAFGKFFFG